MQRRSRFPCARALNATLAVLALAAGVRAHQVTPSALTLRPGGEDVFYVVDLGGCPADIQATSLYPNLVKVYAVDMSNPSVLLPGGGTTITVPDRVDQAFVVRAEPGATGGSMAVIEVCWVGSTAPNPPCPENNCTPHFPHLVTIQIGSDPITFGAQSFCGIAGDPVTTDDGEQVLEEPADLDLGGPFPLRFERIYASHSKGDGYPAGSLGDNWRSNFDWRLSTVGGAVEIATPSGRLLRFERGFAQTAWQLAVYEDLPFQLVDTGATRLLVDPRTGVARTFDSTGKLIAVADDTDNTHTLTYSGASLSQVSDGLGRTLGFAYSGGRLASVTDGTRTVSFGYTGGVLTSATNAAGETTSYAYDAAQPGEALLTARTRPEGNTPWTQTYDTAQRVDTQSDASANTTTLAFGAGTGVTTVTNPLADAQEHTHSTDSRLTRFEDEVGNGAPLGYDAQGRRTSVTDRLGRTTSWTFHAASGHIASIAAANGAVTSFGYTARSVGGATVYDLTSIAHAGGASESFAYDAQGNLTTWTDPAGKAWSYTHNARGQVLTETNSAGGVTTLTYNADGTLATAMDDAGNVTSFAYDALRRLQTLTRPDATTVGFTYDAVDRLLSVTDELAQTTALAYDQNGNLVALTDAEQATWDFAYDAMDRLESVTDPLGNAATASFDELGRVASVANGAGDALAFGYDARGRLVSVSDGLANAWSASYDAEDVASGATDPLANATTIATDVLGRPISVTNALGGSVQHAYDALGRPTQRRDELGAATNVTYDSRGLLQSLAAPIAGATTSLVRNDLGQLTTLDHPGAADTSYAYDAQGRLTSVTDPLGRTTSFAYDARNRVDTVTLPGGLGVVDVTWDDADRLVRLLYPDGTDLQYGYDANGRLTNANGVTLAYDAAGRLSDSNGLVIGRDAAGRVTTVELAPGKTITYAYDARGLLTSIADWLGGSTTFGYDAAGRLLTLTRPNGITTEYEYDANGNATSITERAASPFAGLAAGTPISQIQITLNARGEITSMARTPALSALPELGAKSRLFDAAGGVTSWNYDARGRVVHRDDFWSNQDEMWVNWDEASRPVQIRIRARLIDLSHDALDRAISRSADGFDRTYTRNYALVRAPIAIVRLGGADEIYYVHNPAGGLLYSIDAQTNARSFFHYDASFSTNLVSDDLGLVTDAYEYSPLGAELLHTGSGKHAFTFRGYWGYQRHNGVLYHVGSRLYDADAGFELKAGYRAALDPLFASAYSLEGGNPLSNPPNAQNLAPVQRFVDPVTALGITSRDIARAGLLYPFVTASAGFDAGLGLLPVGATGSTPNSSNQALLADVQQATAAAAIPTRGIVISSAGVLGSPGAGYVIAPSEFSYEHGFGLIADAGQRGAGLSYLARVLEDAAAARAGAPMIESVDGAPLNYRAIVDKFRLRFPQRTRLPLLGNLGLVRFFQPIAFATLFTVLATNNLMLPSGAVLSGVTRDTTDRPRASTPFLGNLPMLGALFRQDDRATRRELQVFIRASILSVDE